MARNRNMGGRNRNGGYDLSATNRADSTNERSSVYSTRGTASNRKTTSRMPDRGTSRPAASASRTGARSDSYSRARSNAYSSGSSRRPATGANRRVANLPNSERGTEYSRNAAMNRYSARKGKGRGMSRGKKITLVAVCSVFALLLAGGAAVAWNVFTIANNMKGDSSITTVQAQAGQPYYVLLLGGDSRADSTSNNRSDSIMVARVDESKKQVSLLSIPRDLRVKIPNHGYCKINSAIEYGGYNLVIQEVDKILGVQINYYAFIYFDGFKDLVDDLGGVTVKVPKGTYYNGVTVPAGDAVTIDGTEALTLARCRHGNPPDKGAYAMGDYQRTLNQRNLIKAIAKKILEQNISAIPGLLSSLSKCVETNMDLSKIVSMAQNMKGMNVDEVEAAQMPVAGAIINGAWYAIAYKDVFEDMDDNFVNGRDLMYGIGNFNKIYNDNNLSDDCHDGSIYSYTNYADHYGSFTSTESTTSSSTDSTSGTTSSTSTSSSSTSTSDDSDSSSSE